MSKLTGVICPQCNEPILDNQATEHTDEGLSHHFCTDAAKTPRERKLGKMHGREIQLGTCENCHQCRVRSDGLCIQCGHRQGIIE